MKEKRACHIHAIWLIKQRSTKLRAATSTRKSTARGGINESKTNKSDEFDSGEESEK